MLKRTGGKHRTGTRGGTKGADTLLNGGLNDKIGSVRSTPCGTVFNGGSHHQGKKSGVQKSKEVKQDKVEKSLWEART